MGGGSEHLTFDGDSAGYGAKVVRIVEHTGDLAGMSTYRLYITVRDEADKLSSVFGNAELPLNVSTTTSWFQDPIGSNYGTAINPLLFGVIPSLEYDWVTLGRIRCPTVPWAKEKPPR